MYPWILWELVANPLGSVEHSLGNLALMWKYITQLHMIFPYLLKSFFIKKFVSESCGAWNVQFYILDAVRKVTVA